MACHKQHPLCYRKTPVYRQRPLCASDVPVCDKQHPLCSSSAQASTHLHVKLPVYQQHPLCTSNTLCGSNSLCAQAEIYHRFLFTKSFVQHCSLILRHQWSSSRLA